jgi:hypothetical protein
VKEQCLMMIALKREHLWNVSDMRKKLSLDFSFLLQLDTGFLYYAMSTL